MTPEQRLQMEKEGTAKGLVYPYCGGCGHRYFNSAMVEPERAKSSLCGWCRDEQD